MAPPPPRRAARSIPLLPPLLLLLLVLLAAASLPGAAARKRSVRYGRQHAAHLVMFDPAQHSKAVAAPPGLWPFPGDPAPPTPGGGGGDSGGGSGGGSGSPFDDEALDETLGFSLLALAVWAVASALLVAGFVRRERRKATNLKFWRAIHARPDLKRAVEQAAGGVAEFPAPPRHSVLRRFLRATVVALVITLGLNVVLMTARPTDAGGDDDGGDGGGGGSGGGSGGSGGGGGDPFDPSADGAVNPLLSIVFALLFGASAFLVVRGLYACCCGRGAAADEEEESGAGYAPLPLDTASGNGAPSAASAYFVGVPVSPPQSQSAPNDTAPSAPPRTPSSERARGEEDEAPPPYSAAVGAVPAALV